VSLRKKYTEDENYTTTCDVEFVAKIKGESIMVKALKTPLNRGSIN
jgi:hypothetical protein